MALGLPCSSPWRATRGSHASDRGSHTDRHSQGGFGVPDGTAGRVAGLKREGSAHGTSLSRFRWSPGSSFQLTNCRTSAGTGRPSLRADSTLAGGSGLPGVPCCCSQGGELPGGRPIHPGRVHSARLSLVPKSPGEEVLRNHSDTTYDGGYAFHVGWISRLRSLHNAEASCASRWSSSRSTG